MRKATHSSQWPRRLARTLGLAAACLLGAVACQQEVTNPSIITPNNLSTAGALPTIRDAALGDFALAYTGSGADGSSGIEGVSMYSGLLADEFINSETFPTRIEVDRRSIQVTNGDVTLWFRNLHRARRSAEFAAARYRSLSPDTTVQPGLSEMLSLSGYTYVFFAENFCSGVPVSTANADGSLTYGPPLTTTNLLDSAVSRFTQALVAAQALDTTKVSKSARNQDINLASVGMGRALLDQNPPNFAGATAAVAGVPTSFVYYIYHSQNNSREYNGEFVATWVAKRYAVADGEGTNGLHFITQGDGRTPVTRNGVGFDQVTPQWNPDRFLNYGDPDPLATGAEARLIEAEAALNAGDTATFLARHDALRASPPVYFAPVGFGIAPLAPLTLTGLTASQVQDLHFQEREYWLWNSGHRLGDLRRMTHPPYTRAPESIFPTGAYFKGGSYGTDYNFPVPFDETNNPDFKQCLDRNP